jgi:hypothetical protein
MGQKLKNLKIGSIKGEGDQSESFADIETQSKRYPSKFKVINFEVWTRSVVPDADWASNYDPSGNPFSCLYPSISFFLFLVLYRSFSYTLMFL